MSHAIASPAAWAVWPLAAACVAPATSSPDELAVQLARAMKAHPVALPAELRKTRPRWLAAVDCSDVREHGARLTLMALQGLVNREGPRLYLVAMHGFNADADRFWLERFQDEYGIPHRLMSVEEALREFASGLPGVVIWDEDLPVTRNIALMIASLTGYLPVSPVGAARRAVSSEGEIDLRGVFSDHLAAQRWAIERLLPHLDKTNVGCVCERDRSLSLCRDYLVMRGAFMCDLSSSPTHPEERALKAELYSRLAPGAIVWGWTSRDGEGEHVRQASEHGLRVLCSTNSPNLSVFTQLAPKARRFAVRPRPEPPVPERKIYLTFVLSDGDSIPILLTRQWYRWDEQARGRVPFGWELQPLFAELAPVVLEYYYDTASPNDSFIAGPSGAGYVHPSRLPDPGAHMAATRDADKRLGVRVVGIIDEWDADAARAWSRALPGADGFLYGWGAAPGQPLRILGGKPHLHYWLCPPRPDGEKDDAYYAGVASRIRDIARREGKPCFIAAHLSCYWA
ncbi:MAG: GxGYxYP domain-containing protein, partial [Armatimonadota bacterium]